jgi:hypothetical protein
MRENGLIFWGGFRPVTGFWIEKLIAKKVEPLNERYIRVVEGVQTSQRYVVQRCI